MDPLQIGDSVAWRWASGIAEGVIVAVSTERVEIFTKGKRIVRNGSTQNPAISIQHSSGNLVLKLQSEIQKTN